MSRMLVITADDFGYCAERNRGILEAFLSGGITRASLLVNASCAEEAVVLAAEHQIPLGLHLNITEGSPLSPRDDIPSLLTTKQYFKGKLGFRSSLAEGSIDLEEVKLEIKAQIRKFSALTGHLPLYVDGHQHVHILAGICKVFAEVLEESGIFSTRLPLEFGIEEWAWIPNSRRDFYSSVVNDAKEAKIVFRNHGLRFGDGFVGMATMGQDMSRQTLEDALYTAFLPRDKSSASYPGAGNPMLNCDMQTVNSTTTNTTTTTTCPQPGAVSPCDAGAVVDGAAAGEVGAKIAHSSEPGVDRDNAAAHGSLHRCSVAHHCDTALFAGSKDTVADVRIMPTSSHRVEIELMTHPGYRCVDGQGGCGEGPDDFARSSDRLHELNVLLSPWFQAFCKTNSIQLGHDFLRGNSLS